MADSFPNPTFQISSAAAVETGEGAEGVIADSFPNPTFQRSPPILNPEPLSYSWYFPLASPAPSASSPPYKHPRVADGAPGDQLKRKRGRSRKYNPEATLAPTQATINPPASSPTERPASPSSSSKKKSRGRQPASGLQKQGVEVLGSTGTGFKPHTITVQEGEQGPGAICILSATGAISNVTIRHASTSAGTTTFQGRFDILSLSGSFSLGDQRSSTGGLNVTFAGPGGNVRGGCVAGLLTAASPVQVILGSFMADGRKESKSRNRKEPLSAPLKVPGGASGASNSPSRGTLGEPSGGPGSPSAPLKVPGGASGASRSPSWGTLGEPSGGPGSPSAPLKVPGGASWASSSPSWGTLGGPSGGPGNPSAPLKVPGGASWASSSPSWGTLGGPSGGPGNPSAPLKVPGGASGACSSPSWGTLGEPFWKGSGGMQ